MVRSIRELEGLAASGRASLGPITVDAPALLESVGEGESPSPGSTAFVRVRPGAPSGVRWLTVEVDDRAIDLELPVATPEISAPAGGVAPAGPRAFVVHAPVSDWAVLSGAELIVLGNARALWDDGETLVRVLRDIREHVGAAPLIWAPRVALPHRIPMLVYLGVDLADTTEGRWRAAQGEVFDESLGILPSGAPPDPEIAPTILDQFRSALGHARRALALGRLRELVEARLPAEPALAEILRYLDANAGAALEVRVPVVARAPPGRYVLAESLRRPEMRRFRARLIERYRPPPSKEVLLLVPCSRTKPYRLSRSHRRFAHAWEGLPHPERLHVVSVSSPIGVVPRELEDVYPARHYDIPVTGDWSEPERALVREGVRHLLDSGAYRTVIVHLDPTEYEFLREIVGPDRPSVWTIGDGRTTSPEAIASLRSALESALTSSSAVRGGPLTVVREQLAEIAAWQFGRAAADRLFRPPVRLAGRPWFQRLTDGASTDLATWREERGLFQLTIAGAQRMGPEYPLAVEVDARVPLMGDLFAPGVLRADPDIRVGDAVTVLRDGVLAAVGEAELPGPLMTQVGRGIAVTLRHRLHASTDTPKNEGRRREPDGPVV